MPERIIEMLQNINDFHTTLGKVGFTIDGIGVLLSFGFYAVDIGEFINDVCPPIILVLTVISIALKIGLTIYDRIKGK